MGRRGESEGWSVGVGCRRGLEGPVGAWGPAGNHQDRVTAAAGGDE